MYSATVLHPAFHPNNRAVSLFNIQSMLEVSLGFLQPNTDASTTSDNWLAREIGSVRGNVDRSGGGTRERNIRISVSGLSGTVSDKVGRDLLGTSRRVPTVDCAVEECKSGNRLVVGHFVTRLIDACEGEVAVFARLAVFGTVAGDERDVTGLAEFV